jgi:uncharacterized protein (TIGR03118 family)
MPALVSSTDGLMNHLHSYRLRRRVLTGLALPSFLVLILLFLLLFPSAPKSLARGTKPTRANSAGTVPAISFVGSYRQTNLVSDLPGVALVEDRLLSNPFGVALNSNSPFWVVNNNGDRATLYKGDVSGSPLASNFLLPSVAIPNNPSFATIPSLPTAVVANTTSDFPVSLTPTSPAAPAQFIFATFNGGINAWQPALGSIAVVVKSLPGHSYTGLTIGSNASGNLLYAADFANGNIDVFNKDFNPTSVSSNFTDASIPANVHPFNIQNLGGALYVTYAEFQRGLSFDLGFVRKFDTNGVRDTAFAINNGPLVAPWGMAMSPANFGAFSNALLVGNSRPLGNHNPTISAFDPATGALIGNMVDENGAALEIDQLRALVFGNGVNGGDANTLYFSADIFSQQQHGLFGSLKPATSLPTSLLKFSESEYFTSEGAGHIDITVTRSGDVSGTATVNYATVDRLATQKADYEIALGKLTFNPGDTSKTFRVLIVDDNQIGGGSSIDLALVLSNPTGAGLVSPNEATLFIMDNEFDTERQPPNIIDDAPSFVRQHYLDFLNREPDASGFDFWVNQITSCFSQQCIEIKRINVSAAFFLSIEFQRTGMLAYLTEKTAFGGLPRYGPFMRDVQALQKDYVFGAPGADAQLEANKQAFFEEFVRRPAFAAKYAGLTNSQYVFALFGNAEVNSTTAELYIAQLTGTEVVPSTNSPAKGLVILRQTVNQPIVSVSLYLNGLTSAETEAHIHGPAPAGNNAAVIVTLPNGQVVDFQTSLTNSQLLSLSSGFIYIDVHTTNFPNGEIRAQFPQNLFVPDMIVRSLDSGIITRAQALRLIAESDRFRIGELNRAFVLMEYFGYLRRNPDDFPDNNLNGFNFWLAKLDQFNGNFVSADMVKAFIKSTEYRGRFGPP